jgi:NAD+ kinase
MKIAIFGKNRSSVNEYKKEMKKSSLTYDEKGPEVVISLGGDGTFLMAERVYPEVPKLLIRDNTVCVKCDCDLKPSTIFRRLEGGKYKIKKYKKLEAVFNSGKSLKKVMAINDIVIRNSKPVHAIRFTLSINGKKTDELIGDGAVIATPFGSTGYYYSITKKKFEKGIGIAFNNLSVKKEQVIVSDKSNIELILTRGPATFSWDNDEKWATLKTGDIVKITLSKKTAKIVKI